MSHDATGRRYLELKQERADLSRATEELMAAAHAGGYDLTSDQLATIKTNQRRIGELSEQIEVMDVAREQQRAIALNEPAPRVAVGGPSTSGAPPRAADMCWGYRYGVRLNPSPAAAAKDRFVGPPRAFDIALGDYLTAVARAQTPGGEADPRLFRAGPSGGNTGIPSDGGFLVTTDFSMRLMEEAVSNTELASRCTVFDIGANSDGLEAPTIDETSRATGSRWGGVQIYRRAEADTVTATKPTLRGWELRLEDLMGLAYVTDRTLRDAALLGQIYRNAFADEFAFTLDNEIFRGNGVGRCAGIIDSTANPALISVSAETGQTADTVVTENIQNMMIRMRPRSRGRAVWFINQELEPQLQQMTIGTGISGQLVYMPAGGLSGAPYATLYGKPVVAIEQASGLGDLGDIVLADMSRYILIRKGGIDFAESMHVRFIYGENTYRWVQAVNGRPQDRAAVTSFLATNATTTSPFVTLAAR